MNPWRQGVHNRTSFSCSIIKKRVVLKAFLNKSSYQRVSILTNQTLILLKICIFITIPCTPIRSEKTVLLIESELFFRITPTYVQWSAFSFLTHKDTKSFSSLRESLFHLAFLPWHLQDHKLHQVDSSGRAILHLPGLHWHTRVKKVRHNCYANTSNGSQLPFPQINWPIPLPADSSLLKRYLHFMVMIWLYARWGILQRESPIHPLDYPKHHTMRRSKCAQNELRFHPQSRIRFDNQYWQRFVFLPQVGWWGIFHPRLKVERLLRDPRTNHLSHIFRWDDTRPYLTRQCGFDPPRRSGCRQNAQVIQSIRDIETRERVRVGCQELSPQTGSWPPPTSLVPDL